MPRLLEELQFPSMSEKPNPPKYGVSLYNANGVLKILHADDTEEIIATGELGEIGLDDYYTKGQVDDLLSALGPSGFEVIILESGTLPESGESGKMYLLPNGNVYTEYLYVSGKWEMIGSTTIDLSGYALKTEIPKVVSQLENDAGYLTQHQDLSAYALKSELPDLSPYALKTDIPNTYTKTEIDSKLENAGGKATFRTWTGV